MPARRIHGQSQVRTRAYRAWESMFARTRNPGHSAFALYGGRGIVVCARWHDFTAFYADMGDCPAGLSLDRIDNDGTKLTADAAEQIRRRRANGETCRALGAAFGVRPQTISKVVKGIRWA
jgi:hypothetical protein